MTIETDAAAGRGIQQITYRKRGKTGHVTVIVADDTAYLRGDAFTLANYLGFAVGPAANYAGKWVRFPHSDTGYDLVAAGVTMSLTIDELDLSGTLSRVRDTTIDGQRVFGVRGTTAAVVDTVYARATGSHLPVREVVTKGAASVTWDYSKWNEHVDVTVPKTSTPISVVRKSRAGPGA